jgi:hypothetical protein
MMGVVSSRSAGKVDILSTRRIDETLYIGNVSGLVNNQTINIHPITLLEKNPAQLMATIMSDPVGQMIGKWVEKEVGAKGLQIWYKLSGITSSISSRDITLFESSKDFRKVRDLGVMTLPAQITNEDTKIAVTGLGTQSINLVSNIEFGDGLYAGYALYPPSGKHIYISPEGRICLFIAFDYGGLHNPVELFIIPTTVEKHGPGSVSIRPMIISKIRDRSVLIIMAIYILYGEKPLQMMTKESNIENGMPKHKVLVT